MGGGGIHVYGNNFFMTIGNCTFVENLSFDYGAALAVNSGNYYMNISECAFHENIASNYGGGIAILSDNRYLILSSSEFYGNIAGLAGGGYYSLVLNTFATIENSRFTYNSAELYGGGAYFGNDHQRVHFTSCSFIGNNGESGAGIYLSAFNFRFDFGDCEFEANTASNMGGGIYCSAEEVIFTTSLFLNNTANVGGGVFYTSDSERQSRNVVFRQSVFLFNLGYLSSGGMSIDLLEEGEVSNCTFDMNVGGQRSGAMSILKSTQINISDTIMQSNKCGFDAGGLYLDSSSSVQIYNVSFLTNVAVKGAAVWMHDCDKIQFLNCSIISNLASLDGGGTFINSSSAIFFTSTVFDSNVALTSSGSAVWASLTQPLGFNLNQFSNNTGTVMIMAC